MLHERIVLVAIDIADVPHVPADGRVEMLSRPKNFWCVKVHYGFMDKIDAPAALERCAPLGLQFDMMQTSSQITL